ncbi:MAG: gamma-glutamyltransferase [Rhizobiaceae bacterium]
MALSNTSLIATLFTFTLLLPASAQQATDEVSPEAAISLSTKKNGKPVHAKNWMVSVANPVAASVAARILEKGGSAADAAIAAQAMLGLVEPQSSGLGGGAFLVHYDSTSGKITTLDGRETAPAAATPKLFQNEQGEPLKFFDAVVGGRSVGTPGTPALMGEMHRKWGKLPWSELLNPAIQRAREGFTVSARLAGLVETDKERLSRQSTTRNYFLPEGKPIAVGAVVKNQAYANVLEGMSKDGVAVFYEGKIAADIVNTVTGFTENPGLLAQTDLADYEVKERAAVCAPYRAYSVCGMGPPSSGALTVGQILGMLQPYDLAKLGAQNPESWRLIGDASRLAFADRGRYMADSDFVDMPTKGLLKPGYLKTRSALLNSKMALEKVEPGEPEWDDTQLWTDDDSIEFPSTTHLSIVDGEGNAVSLTSTIENGFGSRLMTNGFLLNNELTDFSFRDQRDGKPIANRVEAKKRPRSSMAPTIVFKDDKPVLVIGSPGGSRIIGYVAKTIIAHLDWDMDIQKAISSPHLVNRFGKFDVEAGTEAETLIPQLQALGFEVGSRNLTSGLHGIAIGVDYLEGGADHRREGIVLGN